MCLAIIDQKKQTKKYGKSGYGWKVFRENKEGLFGEFYHLDNNPYVVGKRYTAKSNKLCPIGFHTFIYEDEARRWCSKIQVVRKVKWSNPIYSGKQSESGFDVIVSKYMTILPEEKKK